MPQSEGCGGITAPQAHPTGAMLAPSIKAGAVTVMPMLEKTGVKTGAEQVLG